MGVIQPLIIARSSARLIALHIHHQKLSIDTWEKRGDKSQPNRDEEEEEEREEATHSAERLYASAGQSITINSSVLIRFQLGVECVFQWPFQSRNQFHVSKIPTLLRRLRSSSSSSRFSHNGKVDAIIAQSTIKS